MIILGKLKPSNLFIFVVVVVVVVLFHMFQLHLFSKDDLDKCIFDINMYCYFSADQRFM